MVSENLTRGYKAGKCKISRKVHRRQEPATARHVQRMTSDGNFMKTSQKHYYLIHATWKIGYGLRTGC